MTDEIQYAVADGEIRTLPIGQYPSGEPMVKYIHTLPVTRVLMRTASMSSFLAGLFWIDGLAARGFDVPQLILPMVPGARQDRLNSEGDFLFTAKSVAAMINARHFPLVTILDPHSDVTPALINRCDVLHARAPAAWCWSAVISPDAGAEKRAGAMAKLLGVPLLRAWKTRDVKTGAISGFGMEPTDPNLGPRVLVVDDICDGGGTFVGLADVLDRARLVADLYVTHGIFSKGTGPLLARFRHVYCTDSVLGDKPGVTVNPVCERLLKGESI